MIWFVDRGLYRPLLPSLLPWCEANGVQTRKTAGNLPWDKEDTGGRSGTPWVDKRFSKAKNRHDGN